MKWEEFYQKTDGNRYPDTSIIRFISKKYFIKKTKSSIRILDLGCGSGALLWYLSREGYDAYGIDSSKTAIDKAGKRLKLEKLSGHLYLGSFINLPFPDHYMDSVIDSTSIQHSPVESIHKAIDESYRVLKKGGFFFGMEIARSNNLSCADYKTHFFKKREILELFKKFRKININHMIYTEEDERKSIKFWLVECQK